MVCNSCKRQTTEINDDLSQRAKAALEEWVPPVPEKECALCGKGHTEAEEASPLVS